MKWIGIDTGTHTGLAVWDDKKKELSSLEIVDDLEEMAAADTGTFFTDPDSVVLRGHLTTLLPALIGKGAGRVLKGVATTPGAPHAVLRSAEYAWECFSVNGPTDGGTAIAPEIRQALDEEPASVSLTERQRGILQSVARGLTNKEISAQYDLSPISVKKYLSAIFAKIGAANRTEAAAIALRKNLLKN